MGGGARVFRSEWLCRHPNPIAKSLISPYFGSSHGIFFDFFSFFFLFSSFFFFLFCSSLREIGQLGRGIALHSTRINTLLFDRRGIRLFSGDGAGVVNVWRCNGDPAVSNVIAYFARYLFSPFARPLTTYLFFNVTLFFFRSILGRGFISCHQKN